jgi:hypothetical protein
MSNAEARMTNRRPLAALASKSYSVCRPSRRATGIIARNYGQMIAAYIRGGAFFVWPAGCVAGRFERGGANWLALIERMLGMFERRSVGQY